MLKATGQPALHFPHWLQASRLCPLMVSTCWTKSPLTVAIDIMVLIKVHLFKNKPLPTPVYGFNERKDAH